jgi:hypothetical protein
MNIVGKFTIFISHKTRIKIVFSVLKSRYVCPSWHFRQHNCQVTSYNWMNNIHIYAGNSLCNSPPLKIYITNQ